jgi:hypothetical protein
MLRRILSVVRGVLVAIDDYLGSLFRDTQRERLRRGELDPQEEMRRNINKGPPSPPPPTSFLGG